MGFNEWWDWQIRTSNGVVPSNECKAWAVLAYYAGKNSNRSTGDPTEIPQKKPEPTVEELKVRYDEDVEYLRSLVVSRFDEDGTTEYRQGYPTHELEDVVTAEHLKYMSRENARLKMCLEHILEGM